MMTMGAWLSALWTFSRPHTIVGTTLSVLGLFVLAIPRGTGVPFFDAVALLPPPAWSLRLIIAAWIACIAGNIYIVGLNQITDIDIDRINKPHLPLASGAFSPRMGGWIVAIAGAIALVLAPLQGPFLTLTVWSSVAIGTAYSLPPVRLKRFPFWASACIFTVRGVIVNLGLFLHFHQRLHNAVLIPSRVWLLTLFVLVFTFAIAIFKDIPDIEGDRQFNITTFTVTLGSRTVFNLARWVITACYGGMIVASLVLQDVGIWLLLFHLVTLTAFWLLSLRVNLESKVAIARFYQLIWKLFFLEYMMFPLLGSL